MRFITVFSLIAAVVAFGTVHGELKSVAILFRHGERTPAMAVGNYGDSQQLRELGVGQLTLTGSKQLFENGVDLRNRYLSLLPPSGYFRTSNMRVLSSSVERCIASLSSFMAGFLPPPASDRTIPFRWQAFPFAVDNEARVLTIDQTSCASFYKDFVAGFDAIESDPKIKRWLAEDKNLLKRLGDYMGAPITTFHEAFYAAEAIRTQQYLDPSMPAWVRNSFAQMQRYFVAYADLFHRTELMKKVRGGPMLTQMVDNMVAKRDNSPEGRNILIFSAHDFTLVSLLTVLNVKSQAPLVAAYADTIAVEMHQNGRAEPEVQVYYISSTLPFKFKILLNVPNCGTPCRLSTFNNLVSKYLVRDYNSMCRV